MKTKEKLHLMDEIRRKNDESWRTKAMTEKKEDINMKKQYRVCMKHLWVDNTMWWGGVGKYFKTFAEAQEIVRKARLDPLVTDAWVECREVTPWEIIREP